MLLAIPPSYSLFLKVFATLKVGLLIYLCFMQLHLFFLLIAMSMSALGSLVSRDLLFRRNPGMSISSGTEVKWRGVHVDMSKLMGHAFQFTQLL